MMDGQKERERERGEEKESDETEEDAEGAALLWQEGSSDDDLGLPIMHWEALSLRIAQLEKQEEERREKNKVRVIKSIQNVECFSSLPLELHTFCLSVLLAHLVEHTLN